MNLVYMYACIYMKPDSDFCLFKIVGRFFLRHICVYNTNVGKGKIIKGKQKTVKLTLS